MTIKCTECDNHSDICCPDCGKDYYLTDEAKDAELATLREHVERMREALEYMLELFSSDGLLRRGAEVNAAIELTNAALQRKQRGSK